MRSHRAARSARDFDGTSFYKSVEKFENKWLSTYKPEQPSEEDTLEVARELFDFYAPMIRGVQA